jgi:hypothetical protein
MEAEKVRGDWQYEGKALRFRFPMHETLATGAWGEGWSGYKSLRPHTDRLSSRSNRIQPDSQQSRQEKLEQSASDFTHVLFMHHTQWHPEYYVH